MIKGLTVVEAPNSKAGSWHLGDQRWSQDPDTGAFDLVDYRELGPPAPAHQPLDVATMTGARISLEPADRGTRAAALYPGAFKYSPITGRALPEPCKPYPDVWLPPFGDSGSATLSGPRGLRLTPSALSLLPDITFESLPHVTLPLPPAGTYQFVVGPFTTATSALLAIEAARGLLYCWLPQSNKWEEISTSRLDGLTGSSLSQDAWGMAAPDLLGSSNLFLPTDHGLAVVAINVVGLTYRTTTRGTRCIAAPAQWQGRIYALMQKDESRVAVHALDPRTLEMIEVQECALAGSHVSEWMRPIIDRRQIIWMSPAGQLVVKQAAGATIEMAFVPWPAGLKPRFDFGSPYVSSDGNAWQQCFHEVDGHFAFVQLGRDRPDVHLSSSPRLSTGSASFKLETVLPENPWVDPVDAEDSAADEVIVPLLESPPRPTLLCARVPSTSSIDSVFASREPHTVTFELGGQKFFVARLARPWTTRAFVFAGRLHLCHADLRHIPGWRMR